MNSGNAVHGGIGLLNNFFGKFSSGIFQTLCQIRVGQHAGFVDDGVVLIGKQNLIVLLLDLHLSQFSAISMKVP